MDKAPSSDLVNRSQASRLRATRGTSAAPQNPGRITEGGAALRPILEGLADWFHTHLKKFHQGITGID
jgi:hypothetical protein